ncbi:MAG: phosphoribosylformylglycinamidine synthase, partial [Nitrosomonadales bacterium]|nr:phosphoribosylformylglycinamidine synthase [Nitrosomonadales bacterium]
MQKNQITFFLGSEIYSQFRKKALKNQIKNINSEITSIEAIYTYVIESKDLLTNATKENLQKLLGADNNVLPNFKTENNLFIGPRIGTISPWSSRATDIIKNCGINILRIERLSLFNLKTKSDNGILKKELLQIGQLIYDKMTDSIFLDQNNIKELFIHKKPSKISHIDILRGGIKELENFNFSQGLALSEEEINYLFKYFNSENRNPTDAELMMFAQANSEHCRHKIFNANWVIEEKIQEKSLFKMIKNTHELSPQKTVVAYSDNSSIIEGSKIKRFYPNDNDLFKENLELTHYLMKVETHNHPTAISPFAGAATGAGGEIRDEGATGRGSKPKAGLSGFSVSNLNIPNFTQPWEKNHIGLPKRIASPLKIMIDGPIGAASYNNEFGRPNILGYFRT